jgi:hypothetical protein
VAAAAKTATRTGRASAPRPCAGGWAASSWAAAALAQDVKGKGGRGEQAVGEKQRLGRGALGRPTTRGGREGRRGVRWAAPRGPKKARASPWAERPAGNGGGV